MITDPRDVLLRPVVSEKSYGLLDERQYNFCRVLCAFAERCVDQLAATDGRLLPLVQLVFSLLGGELRVAELTVDVWIGRKRLVAAVGARYREA